MEERYEIRGKIGQGGLGAVYRGYDTRMSREVAIKRISATAGDPDLEEESTRQLIKEAGALASLQHPHIVTIYDVGSDEDGPYVVMELISGKTLDELIERAPLTWPDFRELALQTQEALIAAQELDLIHSDLKPSNVMLTWLPSGKFQVKIVDFGLATLTHSQSKQDLEEMEAVFGSIFFMAPEQFERVPLDARTDMYAMGCVYYQALTGLYPFDGASGVDVMNAHLQHQVIPIQNVRSDIPIWACDWIMWHLNRLPADRPESAREALQVFLQNDKVPNPKMSLGTPPPPQDIPHQPLKARGLGSQTIRLPRPGTALTRGPQGQLVAPAAVHPVPAVPTPTSLLSQNSATQTKTAPQPLLPPEGSKPSVHTAPQPLPEAKPPLTTVVPLAPARVTGAATAPLAAGAAVPTRNFPHVPTLPATLPPRPRKGLGKKEKTTIGIVLGVVAVAVVLIFVLMGGKDSTPVEFNEMMVEAGRDDAKELPVDAARLQILLDANTGTNSGNKLIYKALAMAKATDGTDVDTTITEFTLKNPQLAPEVREALIREVLRRRRHAGSVTKILDYARTSQVPALAVAALQSLRLSATDDQFPQFLDIVQTHANDQVRTAAEETLGEIIGRSKFPNVLASQLGTAYVNASNEGVRQSLLRLLASAGGDQARLLARDSLSSPNRESRIAAITALGMWTDETAFPLLVEFIGSTDDTLLRAHAFDAAFTFVSEPKRARRPEITENLWKQLAPLARTPEQQKRLITGLAIHGREAWAVQLIRGFSEAEGNDAAVKKLAEDTLNRLRGR